MQGGILVLRISLPIPNLVWFVRSFLSDVCSQLLSAVVRGQPFVKLCEHRQHVSVNFVLKLSNYFRVIFSIIKLACDALKELVTSNSCEY